MNNGNNLDKEIVFDPKKLKDMVARIYDAERRNTKTENKGPQAMKDLIQQIIEEEANKCY